MKGLASGKRFGRAGIWLGLLLAAGIESASAQGIYPTGSVVSNFTVYLRRTWTNDAGYIFQAGRPMQLSDFAGSILFVEFFDPT